MLVANNKKNKSVNKMYQLALYLNSDRYDRCQTNDLNKRPTRYHTTTALTAFCCLQFSIHVSCGARGGRGVRAIGVATLNAFFFS